MRKRYHLLLLSYVRAIRGISFNPNFYAMSVSETASVPHASLETINAGDSAQPTVVSSDTSLSNALNFSVILPTFGRQI